MRYPTPTDLRGYIDLLQRASSGAILAIPMSSSREARKLSIVLHNKKRSKKYSHLEISTQLEEEKGMWYLICGPVGWPIAHLMEKAKGKTDEEIYTENAEFLARMVKQSEEIEARDKAIEEFFPHTKEKRSAQDAKQNAAKQNAIEELYGKEEKLQ